MSVPIPRQTETDKTHTSVYLYTCLELIVIRMTLPHVQIIVLIQQEPDTFLTVPVPGHKAGRPASFYSSSPNRSCAYVHIEREVSRAHVAHLESRIIVEDQCHDAGDTVVIQSMKDSQRLHGQFPRKLCMRSQDSDSETKPSPAVKKIGFCQETSFFP